MTLTEIVVIVSGLGIGYWLVGVFLPHARSRPEDDAEAAAERDESPGGAWGFGRDHGGRGEAWHQVLEVDRDASHETIVAAYKRKIAQSPESAAINAAYEEAMRQLRA